ncbi:MAG: site-specific DNA-methyltransferase, partial [Chloroflexota bacterium]|nr:site-specific DNA-methyltransferase [Chloroflexota bacterium]
MGSPNFANRTLYHADNLPVLRGMNTESVDLIATDPPFNKGRDFHATPDSLAAGARFQDRWSWADDVEGEWVDRITDDWPKVMTVIHAARESYGDDMGAFLCFLGVRLLEMRRVLKSTGSLYLHIDHTAHAWVKAMLDAVFGRGNFRNEIIWAYTGPSNSPRWFPRKHDTILFYSKSDAAPFYGPPIRIPHRSGIHNDGTLFNMRDNAAAQAMRQREAEGKPVEDWWADIAGGGGPLP